jgi:GGDEF domain-containing protein
MIDTAMRLVTPSSESSARSPRAALRPNDVFGRMGGEEFAVVLPGSSIEAAYARAERIRASFAASCRFAGTVRSMRR